MAPFPVTIRSHCFESLSELVTDLEERGRLHLLDNPGQSFPADHYHPMIFEDANLALAVSEAATELMRRSSDPGVLLLCAHVGPGSHAPFYSAVLDRLDGTGAPLPDAPGAPGPRLVDDLARIFYRPVVRADRALFRRAMATLERIGALDAMISTLFSGDPEGLLPDVMVRYSQQASLDVTIAGMGASGLAKRAPDDLLRIAAHFASAAAAVREQFAARVERANPTWHSQHGGRLRQALGLGEEGGSEEVVALLRSRARE